MGLDRLGVAQQAAVLVLTPNHIYVPLVYLSVAGSKRCFTGANPSYTVNEVAYQMTATDPALVLVHPSLLETGIAAAKQAGIARDRLYLFSDRQSPSLQGVRDWHSIAASKEDAVSWQWDPLQGAQSKQTVAVINFSSGTTGLSKGVCITHYNLVANSAQGIFNRAKGREGKNLGPERWLSFLPLYHAYAQLFTNGIACKLQIPVYIMPKFSLDKYLEYIQQFKITTIQLVPPVLVMMAKRPEIANYDISSLQYLLCGAAPLSSDLQNELMSRHGMVICQAMGMTETTCLAFMNPDMTRELTGSIGHLLPNTKARLVDDEGQDTPDGQPGELWLKGPQIMLGYWKNEQATRETTFDGWFKTGDVAVEKGGKWWIVDRKKELIKVNGLQVAPAELEAVLLEHPDVADAAAVGITVCGQELPRAYVVLREGAQDKISAQDIQDFVAKKVSKHKQLSGGVKFIDEIPKLASGKIVRKQMKELARNDAKVIEGATKARL